MIDKRICHFIARHHVMTLATTRDSRPWCSNLFYAFDSERRRLIFTSSATTRHIVEGLSWPIVACSIVGRSRVVGRLQGVQIEGRMLRVDDECQKECRSLFVRRFPFAALHLDDLWIVEIQSIKFTDNTLGFGKKLYFKK